MNYQIENEKGIAYIKSFKEDSDVIDWIKQHLDLKESWTYQKLGNKTKKKVK